MTNNAAARTLVSRLTKIEPNELQATILSFAFVFFLMAAYFILRPVRDAMSSEWSDVELSTLWSSTFLFSVVAVIVYGAVISRIRFQYLVPGVYGFFAASFVAFYIGSTSTVDSTIVDKAFYVWLSVFSLFHVSVFWSYMSGLFNREQAPRLFAIIATGASTGAIVGPIIPTFFADNIGTMNLMLIAAALLLVPVPLLPGLNGSNRRNWVTRTCTLISANKRHWARIRSRDSNCCWATPTCWP